MNNEDIKQLIKCIKSDIQYNKRRLGEFDNDYQSYLTRTTLLLEYGKQLEAMCERVSVLIKILETKEDNN